MRSGRDSDSLGRQWIKETRHAQQGQDTLQVVRQLQRQFDTLRTFKGAAGEGGGIKWAKPREYTPSKAYKKNQLVIVSPGNDAVVNGVDGDGLTGVDGHGPDGNRAAPGLWCCIKAPKVSTGTNEFDVHVPIWPLPNAAVDSDTNYWMFIGFIPIAVYVCVGGVNVPHYVQAWGQPESIVGEGGEGMVGEGGEEFAGEGSAT